MKTMKLIPILIAVSAYGAIAHAGNEGPSGEPMPPAHAPGIVLKYTWNSGFFLPPGAHATHRSCEIFNGHVTVVDTNNQSQTRTVVYDDAVANDAELANLVVDAENGTITRRPGPQDAPSYAYTALRSDGQHMGVETVLSLLDQQVEENQSIAAKRLIRFIDDNCAETPAPPAGPTPHLVRITGLRELVGEPGEIREEVTYLLHCNESFVDVIQHALPPYALSRQEFAVAVLAMTNDLPCMGPDREETKTLTATPIAGVTAWTAIQP